MSRKFAIRFRPLFVVAALFGFINSAKADFIRYLQNPADSIRARVNLIESAQERIFFQVYETGPATDALTLEFLTLLYRAANDPQRKVEVYIVFDDFAQRIGKEMMQALALRPGTLEKNPRMHIKIFNRIQASPLSINHRMHNKLLVGDDKWVIVGGRNLKSEYFGLNHRDVSKNYLDADVLLVRNPGSPYPSAAAQMLTYASTFMTNQSKNLFDPKLDHCMNPFKQWSCSWNYGERSKQMLMNSYQRMEKDRTAKFVYATDIDNSDPQVAVTVPLDRATRDSYFDTTAELTSPTGQSATPASVDVGPTQAMYDPPEHSLREGESDDIVFKLYDRIQKEYTVANIIDYYQKSGGKNPQLTIVSPYVSMTEPMTRAILTIKKNVAIANLQLLDAHPSLRIQPLYLDLQLVTSGTGHEEVPSAQECFDSEARPAFLALGGNIWYYNGTVGSPLPMRNDGILHEKMLLVNGQKFFIGSFNSDFRSANLNLEVGFFVDASAPNLTRVREQIRQHVFNDLMGGRKAPDETATVDRTKSDYDPPPGTEAWLKCRQQ